MKAIKGTIKYICIGMILSIDGIEWYYPSTGSIRLLRSHVYMQPTVSFRVLEFVLQEIFDYFLLINEFAIVPEGDEFLGGDNSLGMLDDIATHNFLFLSHGALVSYEKSQNSLMSTCTSWEGQACRHALRLLSLGNIQGSWLGSNWRAISFPKQEATWRLRSWLPCGISFDY